MKSQKSQNLSKHPRKHNLYQLDCNCAYNSKTTCTIQAIGKIEEI